MIEKKPERDLMSRAFIHAFNLVIIIVVLSLIAFGAGWVIAVAAGAALVIAEIVIGCLIMGRRKKPRESE